MKTSPTDPSSRVFTVTDIPQPHPDDLSELAVSVTYIGPGSILKAIPLDNYIIPLFKLAPRLLQVVYNRVGHDLATMGLTPEELAEVKRLSKKTQ